MKVQTAFLCAVILARAAGAHAQSWRLDTRSVAGPVAIVGLPDSQGKRRSSFMAFEYARQCDPLFSFAEISGNGFGTPISQSVLHGSQIGVRVNGKFHTWHAAMTRYSNGYEATFGVTNDLLLQLLVNLDSLEYVTPSGEAIALPIEGFREAVQGAIDLCRKKVK